MNKKLLRKYIKDMYPVGTEVYDSCRQRGEIPYIVKKYSVFEIHPWKKSDYNPDFLPDDPDDYTIEFLVRDPGNESPLYGLRSSTMRDIKDMYEYWRKRADKEKLKEN